MSIFRKRPGIVQASTLLILATGIFIDAEETKNPLKGIPLGFAYLDIGGGLRLRGQFQENFNIKKYAQGNDGFGEERLRLEYSLRFMDDINFLVQLQDAHVGGLKFTKDDFFPPYSSYVNPFDVRQMYGEYRNIANTPLGVKFGRQTIFYGDNRIFGPAEWCNVGRYFWDGIKFLLSTKYCTMDLFTAKQVISDPYDLDTKHSDAIMGGLYSAVTFFNPAIDLFYALKLDDENRFSCSTLGTRIDGNFSMLFYSGTFAYQFGDTGTKKIDAYGLHARMGYLIPIAWHPEMGVEYSYASGDDDPADEMYKTFDGVFGAIDLFYGRMALFSWMNLKDYQINLDIKPTRKISATLQHHWFELAEKKDAWYYGNRKAQRMDITGASGSFLGSEILLTVKYILNSHFNIYTGYCRFFPGEFILNTPGYKGESALAFLQAEYKF